MPAAARKNTAPAAPADAAKAKAPAIDVAALAAGATVAPSLPRVARGSAASPFVGLLRKSWDDKTAHRVPAVPADQVRAVHSAIRRAATSIGLGVSLRDETTSAGVVVTFQAKERAVRKDA